MISQLIAGILALQTSFSPVSWHQAKNYAESVYHASQAYQVDPFELLGIARNESNFREKLVANQGKDCGITQIRARWSFFTCRQLKNNVDFAFQESARILRHFHDSCEKSLNPVKCRLNRYNSGYRYHPQNKYWLRVLCFAEQARQVKQLEDRCRQVKYYRQIKKIIFGK